MSLSLLLQVRETPLPPTINNPHYVTQTTKIMVIWAGAKFHFHYLGGSKVSLFGREQSFTFTIWAGAKFHYLGGSKVSLTLFRREQSFNFTIWAGAKFHFHYLGGSKVSLSLFGREQSFTFTIWAGAKLVVCVVLTGAQAIQCCNILIQSQCLIIFTIQYLQKVITIHSPYLQ